MKNLLLCALGLLSGCASLEERLCNNTKAFQMGYQDVIEGLSNNPGLERGRSCKDSKNYSYSDFHRDYMAGFEKAKKEYCTKATAESLALTDVSSNREFNSSISKLNVCLSEDSSKTNLKSIYEISYRKAFCVNERAEQDAINDAQTMSANLKTSEDYRVCAYQAAQLMKIYKTTYNKEIVKQCTPPRFASFGIQHARSSTRLDSGYALIEKCPIQTQSAVTQAYTSAYNSERETMMNEIRLDMERKRIEEEQRVRQDQLNIQRQALELEKQKLKNSQLYPVIIK